MAETVSVVMATCNGERFLAAQLESLLAQTRLPDEIVIVDDASDDGTPALLEAWAAREPRIRVHRNPQRLGVNRNFAHGFSLARGELVLPCDQDDTWLPGKVAALLAARGDAWLVASDARVVDAGGRELAASEIAFHGAAATGDLRPARFLFGNFLSGHNMLLHRELLARAQPLPDGVVFDQWLAFVAAAAGRLRVTGEALCLHRMHGGNLVNDPAARAQQKRARRAGRREQHRRRLAARLELCRRVLALPGEDGPARRVAALLEAHLARAGGRLWHLPTFLALLPYRDDLFPGLKPSRRWRRVAQLAQGELAAWA